MYDVAMENKKKPKRCIPVAIKTKYPIYGPKNVANRIRKQSGSKTEKSPGDNPCKSSLEVKGPFNPDIIAKFRNPKEPPRLRVRSSSETRKENEKKPVLKSKDDLDLHHHSPTQRQIHGHRENKPTHHPHIPVKRITRRRSAEDEAKLTALELEKDALSGTVEALKERMHQYEGVMKSLKVDPSCLKELLLNEENINKERSDAAKSAEELKELLQQNLLIANSVNELSQEILAFTDN